MNSRDRLIHRAGTPADGAIPPGAFGYRHTSLDDRASDRATGPEEGIEASDSTVRRGPARGRLPLEAAPVRAVAAVADVAARQRGLQASLKKRAPAGPPSCSPTPTILTETPPLRACWAKTGEQAEVPITGNRSKRVVYGALNVGTRHDVPWTRP